MIIGFIIIIIIIITTTTNTTIIIIAYIIYEPDLIYLILFHMHFSCHEYVIKIIILILHGETKTHGNPANNWEKGELNPCMSNNGVSSLLKIL